MQLHLPFYCHCLWMSSFSLQLETPGHLGTLGGLGREQTQEVGTCSVLALSPISLIVEEVGPALLPCAVERIYAQGAVYGQGQMAGGKFPTMVPTLPEKVQETKHSLQHCHCLKVTQVCGGAPKLLMPFSSRTARSSCMVGWAQMEVVVVAGEWVFLPTSTHSQWETPGVGSKQ